MQQLVERDPEGRPSSATEVADQLVGIMAEITDGEPLGAMTVDPGDPNTGRSLERESAKTNTTEPARRGGRRLWLAIAGAVIAVAAAVLILTRMGGSEPEPNAATTPEPAVSATSAAVEPVVADVADESTVTEAAAIPTPSEGDLDSVADVPLPEVAVIDRVDTEPDRRIVANVAGSVADIEAFYENVEGWQILNRAANGEARMLLVTGDGPQFTVDLTPTALSSGSTTTSIVIEGST